MDSIVWPAQTIELLIRFQKRANVLAHSSGIAKLASENPNAPQDVFSIFLHIHASALSLIIGMGQAAPLSQPVKRTKS